MDQSSLTYDSAAMVDDVSMVGSPRISMFVQVTRLDDGQYPAGSVLDVPCTWHVRVEDVSPEGAVRHVTGSSLNGAFRDGASNPSLMQSGETYVISMDLHFSTWTFQVGHKIRIAITNAMWRMMWPSPFSFDMSLHIDSEKSFVALPLVAGMALKPPQPPHKYSLQRPSELSEPVDGWWFAEGGYPYLYSVNDDIHNHKVVVWNASYFSNCYGWLISVELDYQWRISKVDGSDCIWTGYARQIYQYVGVTDKSYWAAQPITGLPLMQYPKAELPAVQREFILETQLEISSNATHFFAYLNRSLTDTVPASSKPLFKSFSEVFLRNFQ